MFSPLTQLGVGAELAMLVSCNAIFAQGAKFFRLLQAPSSFSPGNLNTVCWTRSPSGLHYEGSTT